MPKLTRLIAVALLLLMGTETAAAANDQPIISENPTGVQVGARSVDRSNGSGANHGGDDRRASGTPTSVSCSFTPTAGGPALTFTASCMDPAAVSTPLNLNVRFMIPVPADRPPGSPQPAAQTAVSPAVLARQAYRFLPLPTPAIRTNPPADRQQLANLPTWLWLGRTSWGPRTATASIPGLSVTVTAVPVVVTWTMGDGGRVVCRGPGTAFEPAQPARRPSCVYTYRRSSAGQPAGRFTVTATTTWNIAWTASGSVTGGGTLPPLARSAQTALAVAEVQAINTPDT
jgi:hypothetical protein